MNSIWVRHLCNEIITTTTSSCVSIRHQIASGNLGLPQALVLTSGSLWLPLHTTIVGIGSGLSVAIEMRSAGALNGLTYVLSTCCNEIAGNTFDLQDGICIPSVSYPHSGNRPGLDDTATGRADIRLIGVRGLSNESPKAPLLIELGSHFAWHIVENPFAKFNEAIGRAFTMAGEEWCGSILVNRIPVKDGSHMLNHPSDHWQLISQSDFEPRLQRGLQRPEKVFHCLHCAFRASIGCTLAYGTEFADCHSQPGCKGVGALGNSCSASASDGGLGHCRYSVLLIRLKHNLRHT